MGHAQQAERLRGDRFLDPQQPEQDVLGADLRVFQQARLALGGGKRLTAVDAEALDHRFLRAAAAARAERIAWPATTGP
jgi:hypothetical protein